MVLTAALSVYNAVVYCTVRQLHAMAGQGHAPKVLLRLNRNNVPVNALWVTAAVTALAVLFNWFSPNGTLETLMALVVATTIMNWMLTSITHLKFRRAKLAAGETTAYRSPLFPVSNYLCIAFIFAIMLIMAFIPNMRISVWLIPLWLMVIYASFRKYQSIKASPLEFE